MLNNINAGQVSKILLKWNNPWWNSKTFGVHLAWSREEMDSIALPEEWVKGVSAFSEVEGHQNYLSAWVAGGPASVVDGLDNDIVSSSDIGISVNSPGLQRNANY